MPECGNEKCMDHDVEYLGSCSRHWRNMAHLCPNFQPYKPPDPKEFIESAARATRYLENMKYACRNGDIVRRLEGLLISRKSVLFTRDELEKVLKGGEE